MRVLVALLASLTLVPVAAGYTRVPALEQAASEVAGREVEVRCATFPEWWNDPDAQNRIAYTTWVTWTVANYVVLSPTLCTALEVPTAEALVTLGHEAIHMRGIRDEHTAECHGLASLPRLARFFGATDAWQVTTLYRIGRATARYAC